MNGFRTVLPAASLLVVVMAMTACAGPRPVESVRTLADHYYEWEAYERASVEYAEITDRYPGDWQAQYRLGKCYLELDRLSEARAALQVAHERRPKDEGVVDALAEVMFRQGDEERLFSFLRDQTQVEHSVSSFLRLAHYSLAIGDVDSAKLALDMAIEFDKGTTVEPYLQSAKFAERLGDIEQAVHRLRQAYGIDPHDERVSERLVALGEVPGPTLALPAGR